MNKCAPLLSCLLIMALPCKGQSHTSVIPEGLSKTKAKHAVQAPDVPTHLLEFRAGDPLAGMTAYPIVVTPAQCTADGALFLDMRNPKDVRDPKIYSVKDGKTLKFSASAAFDLYDVETIGFFPSDSTVAFLVRATRESSLTPLSVRETGGEAKTIERNRSEHHYFVAEFDREGQYRGSVQLAVEYPVFRLAVLPSGEFLVTGYDQPNDTQRLLLFDQHGALERPIVLPSSKPLSEGDKTSPEETRESLQARSIGSLQFIAHKDSILLWRRGTKDPVLELRAGGALREVPIALPSGYVLADLVPSDDVWVVHLRPSNVSESAAYDTSLTSYYEVMPLDGSLLRKLTWQGMRPGQIACKSRGSFVAYETDEKSQFVELTAR